MKASTADMSQRKLHVEEDTHIHEDLRMHPVRGPEKQRKAWTEPSSSPLKARSNGRE